MKKFIVNYRITEEYFVTVEAEDAEEAKDKVREGEVDHGEAQYLDGSFEFEDFTSVTEVRV